MKTKFTFLFLWIFVIHGFSQDQSFDLLKNDTKTKILYDRVFAVSKANELKPTGVSAANFLQVYHEMQRADFLQRMPNLEVIQKKADEGFSKNYIPLSLLIVDFESIKPSFLESKSVALNTKNQYVITDKSQNVFNENEISLLAPILGKTKENHVEFILKSDLVFNTSNRKVAFIEIQYGAYWNRIYQDQAITINFSKNGLNAIPYRIHFSDGKVLEQSFVMDVQYQRRAKENKGFKSFEPNIVTSISSTIPYKGYGETAAFTGNGEYEVYMGNDGVLDKPIVLVDGFDPGDTRNTAGIYQMLNYGTSQNLGDLIRAQGYDIIVLNFPTYTRSDGTTIIDGGVDYIQRNAMILVELLTQINSAKTGNEKNVVIGPSMGGLISRYALRYMEQNSLNPDTRLYLSFDSPHLGANVPLGFQHLFNYMGFGPVGDVTMQGIVNGMLKSPAAREMLIDHFEGHLQSGSTTDFDGTKLLPAGSPNYRTPFQNELNAIGFPTSTRNISISNGAGNGAMTGTPGMVVMDHTFNTSSTQRAIIKTNFTPAQNVTAQVSSFQGQQWILFWITFYNSAASAKSPATSDGLDSAPGGRFDLQKFADAANGNAMLTEFMNNLKILYFNFIPATSSMAVSNNNGNYYSNINSSSTTPFASYYIPNENQNHVTLNDQNVQFALNEILNYATLGNNEAGKLKNITIENPVKNSLRIKSDFVLKNTEVVITDFSGRKTFSKTIDIAGNIEIPISLLNGVYMVSITSGSEKITKKVIVNR
ncbi:MAG: T9SS type A sorting domain-containing protein [Flavobacteriales bacterium]|jgi:PGAP1-like protein.|nr:T9SS type A sorting domain-containing protein [Flavobacteriales bacterium]MCA0390783.1 T9SS type A sorting domain-containing protein [Bacteroidota bacterium]